MVELNEMFQKGKRITLEKALVLLRKNEISIKARRTWKENDAKRSKFGGNPAVPLGFEWPRFEADNYDGEVAERPLSFLCQINLEEIRNYDKENLLPTKGMLLFFYEQESMRWGFDSEDQGCSRVYYFEETNNLTIADFPEDLKEEYRVKEFDLVFSSADSYPCYEELDCYFDVECDWDELDEAIESKGYDMESERHKLLGYANLIQGEMLTECERTSRGIYCGSAESYHKMSDEEKEDVKRASSEWMLLFQMASIDSKDYELMFGDVGNVYFYIRKNDLKERNFDNTWLVVQCG